MAGIEADPDAPGFRHALIRPRPGGRLTWVKASYDSLYGTISSEWRLEGGEFVLDVRIPAGASANVIVPGTGAVVEEGAGSAAPGGEAGTFRVPCCTCRGMLGT